MNIDLVFPRFKMLSGAERAILGLAEGLTKQGHKARVVCHAFDPSCRPRLSADVELACTGRKLDWSRNRYVNAVFDYATVLRLRSLMDPRADLQVFFGPALPLAWQQKRLRRTRATVIYYCWEPPRVLYQDRQSVLGHLGAWRVPFAVGVSLYRGLDRWMVGAADALATSSPFAAGQVERCYGRPATVITLGVDQERLDAARRPPAEGSPVLLTVNYLHPRKRVNLAIEALAKLRRQDEHVRNACPILRIIGDGPERTALEALTRRLGLERQVEFAGFVADDELPRQYWAATCYVHTALEESFGLSVIEAAYCARPVVAVDEGGVRQTVEHGVTGYRVQATADDVAGALARVLALPDRGLSLGEAGRQRIAAHYQWQRGTADLLSLARGTRSR